MSGQTITTRKATLEDTEEVQRIWAASFANDSHTLFKAHEKGIEPVQELPLDLVPSWIDIKPEDGVFLVGTDTAGRILGWASWCFYNLEGAKAVVSSYLVTQLTPGRFA
jgi:L-amino acid N-acyltransferase YncA